MELSGDQSLVDLQESEESITTREQSEQSTVFKVPEVLIVQKELLNVMDTVNVADTQQLFHDFQDTMGDSTPQVSDDTMGDSTPQVSDTSKDVTVIDTVIPDLSVVKTLPPENPNLGRFFDRLNT